MFEEFFSQITRTFTESCRCRLDKMWNREHNYVTVPVSDRSVGYIFDNHDNRQPRQQMQRKKSLKINNLAIGNKRPLDFRRSRKKTESKRQRCIRILLVFRNWNDLDRNLSILMEENQSQRPLDKFDEQLPWGRGWVGAEFLLWRAAPVSHGRIYERLANVMYSKIQCFRWSVKWVYYAVKTLKLSQGWLKNVWRRMDCKEFICELISWMEWHGWGDVSEAVMAAF